MTKRSICISSFVLLVATAGAGTSAGGPQPVSLALQAFDAMAHGRALTRQFMAGDLDSLQGSFNPQMSGLMRPRQMQTFYDQVTQQLGALTNLLDERVVQRDSMQTYTRLGLYVNAPLTTETTWTFDPRGKVAGFSIRPATSAAPTRFLEYQTRTALRLPFEGAWWVFWGGRILIENLHITAPDQRFATDLVMRQGEASHAGEGNVNTDYYCFGRPVLAPGDGTVVAVLDTVTDNTPGVMNRQQPLGNYVILDHGHREFSFLCHFQKNSVQVQPGQTVHAGQVLASCGNSGNSSEPHVHYHMQNTAVPFKGEGLPAQFLHYSANGETVERGEPKQGQTVAPLAPPPAAPMKKAVKKGAAAKTGKAAK